MLTFICLKRRVVSLCSPSAQRSLTIALCFLGTAHCRQADPIPLALPLPSTAVKASERAQFGVIGGDTIAEPMFFAGLVYANSGERFCGGSFINELVVVTAAHCVHDLDPSQVAVRKYLPSQKRAIDFAVNHINVHSSYQHEGLRNDIALVFLRKSEDPARQPRLYSQAIALNTQGTFPEEQGSTGVQAIGYGNTTNFGRKFLSTMQHVELPVVAVSDCQRRYDGLFGRIDTTQICAGDIIRGGIDTCQGDSGGPLYAFADDMTPVLVGIVSYGQGCADKAFPGVYTRVSHFTPWIEATLSAGGDLPHQPTGKGLDSFLAHYCGHDYKIKETIQGDELDDSFQVQSLLLTKQLTLKGSWRQVPVQADTDQPRGRHETTLCDVQTKEGRTLTLKAVTTSVPMADSHSLTFHYQATLHLSGRDDVWTAEASAAVSELQVHDLTGQPFWHKLGHDLFAKGTTPLVISGRMDEEPREAQTLFELDSHNMYYRFLALESTPSRQRYGLEFAQAEGSFRRYVLGLAADLPGQTLPLRLKQEGGDTSNPHAGKLTVLNVASTPIYNWALTCETPLTLRDDQTGQQFVAQPADRAGFYTVDFSQITPYATLAPHSATKFRYTTPPPLTSDNPAPRLSCSINGKDIPIDYLAE